MRKLSILNILMPAVSLVLLAWFWLSNRSAQASLDAVRLEVRSLAKIIDEQDGTPPARPAEIVTSVAPEMEREAIDQEPVAVEDLPPIVVPETIEELAHHLVDLVRFQKESSEQELAEDEEVRLARRFMQMATPLIAGYDYLRSELEGTAGAGRLIGLVIGGALELGEENTDRLITDLVEAREAILNQGEDREIASERFFAETESYLTPAQVEEMKDVFGKNVENLGNGHVDFLKNMVH